MLEKERDVIYPISGCRGITVYSWTSNATFMHLKKGKEKINEKYKKYLLLFVKSISILKNALIQN